MHKTIALNTRKYITVMACSWYADVILYHNVYYQAVRGLIDIELGLAYKTLHAKANTNLRVKSSIVKSTVISALIL